MTPKEIAQKHYPYHQFDECKMGCMLKASRKDEYGLAFAIDMLLENEQEMLKKEKEVIENAYWDGGQWVPTSGSQCEEYYNETFNTKGKRSLRKPSTEASTPTSFGSLTTS
jgi:hypothetical protein